MGQAHGQVQILPAVFIRNNRRIINRKRSIMEPIQLMIPINAQSDKTWDFTPLYKWLLARYASEEDCPALLLVDTPVRLFLQTEYGGKVILLDKNAGERVNNLKKIHSMKEQKIEKKIHAMLPSLWSPVYNYKVIYTWYLKICQHLHTPMPAFFLSDYLPGYNGLVSPGGDNPNVSDVFVKGDDDPVRTLGTMLHELRHVWQHTYHNDWFSGYQSFDKYDSSIKDDYYEQYSEIDATAFQYWALHHLGFNIHLEDLGAKRCSVISARMEELQKTEKPLTSLPYIQKKQI